MWDGADLMKRGLSVVGLPRGMGVEGLEVNLRRGLPVFLGQITIRWHQVTGVPIGTGSITPNRTSWSSPAFISSCQCKGTGIGV